MTVEATPARPSKPAAARERGKAALRPKDAATLILVDRAQTPPRVLLGKRHTRHAFMPDKFVFPGGRLDAADYRGAATADPLPAAVEAKLMLRVPEATPGKARALAFAAVRETCEETGLVIGRRAGTGEAAPAAALPFAAAGVRPDLSALHFIGRAVTPPHRARRYDTRFFAADAGAIVHRIEGVIGPDAELIELVWMPIVEAQQLDLANITRVILQELERRIADGFDPALPVPFYRLWPHGFVREML